MDMPLARSAYLLALVLATAILLNHAAGQSANSGFTKSLASTWRFSLNAKKEGGAAERFEREFSERIEVPASCEQRKSPIDDYTSLSVVSISHWRGLRSCE